MVALHRGRDNPACYATGSVTGTGTGTGSIYVGGVTGDNFASTLTACYWGGNGQEQGIGYNQAGTGGGTEKVTDGNWSGAKDAMNDALNGLTTWYYDLSNEGLSVLMQR